MNELVTDINQLQILAQDILRHAKQKGASQAECNITLDKGFSVAAHDGDVERVEYHQDKIIEINVMFGKHSGTASLSDMRLEAVQAAVEAACHIAKFTDEDQASGLAEKSELALNYPQLQLAYPWSLTVEQAITLACQCERETRAIDKRIIGVEETNVTTMQAFTLYANSHDFMGYYPVTKHEISCIAIAKQDNEMQRDYAYTVAADPAQLESISQVAEKAAKRTLGRLGAKQIKTMKTPVIFIAEEARGFWKNLVAAISGGNLYRKASFLLNHIDKKILPEFVHIQEYPFLAAGLGSAPFDDDGVLTRENVFVKGGVLSQYILDVYTARKLGLKTSGNAGGIHNLTIKSGSENLTGLLKTMSKGLLITEMMGSGTNLVTGDYSRGAAGFWVENGEIQYPVQEITVAGKLQDMFMRVQEVGNDVDVRGNIRTGSVLVDEVTVAGK